MPPQFAPGTYELVARAPGYGLLRGRKQFYSGENSIIEFRFPTNYAASAKGATATGDGTLPGNLIDDTERTQWTAEGTITGGNLSVEGRKVTIDLAGTDSVRINRLQVSAHLAAGQSRFTALRQFEVWACNNDHPSNDDCSVDSGYHRVYTSPADSFPADPPRPVAPQLILREFDISNTRATHLRFVVKTSQCTGAPLFQGEQDADPGPPRTATRTSRLRLRSASCGRPSSRRSRKTGACTASRRREAALCTRNGAGTRRPHFN